MSLRQNLSFAYNNSAFWQNAVKPAYQPYVDFVGEWDTFQQDLATKREYTDAEMVELFDQALRTRWAMLVSPVTLLSGLAKESRQFISNLAHGPN